MPVKLVALDLDDTLLLPDRTISPSSAEAILRARKQGVQVVLATGRMFRAAAGYVRELHLDLPLIAYQGALIKTVESSELLRAVELDRSVAQPIVEFLEEAGVHINLYIEDELYVAEMNEVASRYFSFSQVPVHVVGRLSAFEYTTTTKLVAIGDPTFLHETLEPRALHAFGGSLAINTSRPHFLEFGHREATKSSALRFLGQKLGIAPAEMMAIGDGLNDLDMIEYVGLGIAMGNADERLKCAADYITASNIDDGVALAIQKFVLAEGPKTC